MADFTTHRTEFGTFRWYADPRKCSHSNDDACPTCDHDGYYRTYVLPPAKAPAPDLAQRPADQTTETAP